MLLEGKFLSEAAADAILMAAWDAARTRRLAVSIAIVDDSGILHRFLRMDGSRAGTVDVAIAKARSAALFRNSGKVFGQMVSTGSMSLLALPNLLPLEGGEPISVDGHPLGGIGVSGSSPENDGEVARAGIAALQSQGGGS